MITSFDSKSCVFKAVAICMAVLILPFTIQAREFYEKAPDVYGCTICLDDCPRRGLNYGEYFCYAPDGSIDFTHERMRKSRDRIPEYMLKNRNRKTPQETSLRYTYMYPSQSRRERMQASVPTNGRGRFEVIRTNQKKDVRTLNKVARAYMRGTMTEGFRKNSSQFTESVEVLRVLSAKTFELRKPQGDIFTAELAGVTVPMYAHYNRPDQCFGKEVHEYVARLLARRGVSVTYNTLSDPYDTGHKSVFLEFQGTDIGSLLISEGYAFADNAKEHDNFEQYEELQSNAADAKKGLWLQCAISS